VATASKALKWFAVLAPAQRTGIMGIIYVKASSLKQAAETFAGSTVLGGPYNTQAAAEKAYPQGSDGSRKSTTGNPTVSDQPANPISSLQSLIQILNDLSSTEMWERVGLAVLGTIIFLVGLTMFALSSNATTDIATVAFPEAAIPIQAARRATG